MHDGFSTCKREEKSFLNEVGHAVLAAAAYFSRVPTFRASKYKITNRQMLAFIQDGGYHKRELWSEDGWQWKTFRDIKWVVMAEIIN